MLYNNILCIQVPAMKTPILSPQHNHNQCITDALAEAKRICQQKGARMTALREQVLRLIWHSHQPLGAYRIMEMLAEKSTRQVAPPTVYRALEFLLEQGLIHRINSLNAFIGCSHPDSQHANNFLICTHCGIAMEFSHPDLEKSIKEASSATGFSACSQSIEISGICHSCQLTNEAPAK